MNLTELKLNKTNITVVFNKLDKDLIRRDFIKQSFEGNEVIITDLPDVLLVILPKLQTQIVFEGRRLLVDFPGKDIEKAADYLAKTCTNLIRATQEAPIEAYGINLDGNSVTDDTDVNNHLLDVCYAGGTKLKSAIGADIISVAPSFSFFKHNALFNLALKPARDNHKCIDFHCNIHFNTIVPEEKTVRQQVLDYLEYFREIMAML
ncbi:MAG: hypothetical protein PHT78_10425 [Desulfitobacteriaceae bacterium]|jgi:hypothetical protein|nr:hypothetical protein [Desulfitobacteriaceae bacterium]